MTMHKILTTVKLGLLLYNEEYFIDIKGDRISKKRKREII